ncbi:DNA-methyltransferase [Terriglobus sp. ADX1]|uniref:DNA-methyltransferase n=1 Tax=Terriglobus sp. ADX1 TaxID=2794063 RepID=UPI002FE5ED93
MKPYYQQDGITIYHGDARDILPQLDDVDHVITDPPYEAEAHAPGRRLNGRGLSSGARRIHEAPLSFGAMTEELRKVVASESARLSRGWVLAFCQAEAVPVWRDVLEDAGAKYRRAMIWVKPDSAPQLSGDRPAMGYESIVAAWAGEGHSVWNGGGKRGVFTHCKHDSGFGHGGKSNGHETRKPLSLMKELVSLFTNEGQIVLDPMCGSGTTLHAAKEMGRRAIGIELKEEYCEMAAERLSQSVLFGVEA